MFPSAETGGWEFCPRRQPKSNCFKCENNSKFFKKGIDFWRNRWYPKTRP